MRSLKTQGMSLTGDSLLSPCNRPAHHCGNDEKKNSFEIETPVFIETSFIIFF
jgi:hypothetical protein